MQAINIIGAGLAGLSAAMTLAEHGVSCNLISVLQSERAQSVLAEGGINAALNTMGEEDDASEHFADTMAGGVWLSDPNAVRNLTGHAPDLVRKLARLGVPFHIEDGHIIQRNFGGQKKKRTAYAKSSTGKVLVSALIDEVRKYEAAGLVKRYPHHEFIRLLLDEDTVAAMDGSAFASAANSRDKRCAGVRIRDTFSGEVFDFPGSVILASGGMNGVFPEMTTGTVANSGDVTATVFSQGVLLSNLEMLQYHPTTIGIAGKRCLVTEAARGEGGRLFIRRNGEPWYFMEEKYPELKNLMPRDVVSREIFFVSHREDCDGQVWLDMTGLPEDTWERKLSDLREEIMHYLPIDPKVDPIPVEPGIHYFMGGIATNVHHQTNIRNLYAAGECTSQYHGANRLGGNSLLGAVFGGKTAAENLLFGWIEPETPEAGIPLTDEQILALSKDAGQARADSDCDIRRLTEEELASEVLLEEATPAFIYQMRDVLLSGMGIVRNEETLEKTLEVLFDMKDTVSNQREAQRYRLAEAMLRSAMMRKESRGAHYREDYPKREEAYRKTLLAGYKDGEITLSFRDLPELKD